LVPLACIGTSLPDGAGEVSEERPAAAGVDAITIREYSHVNVDVNADANVDILWT
jgi:hypothetical protein